MPYSPDAEHELAEAREALAVGAFANAQSSAWRAASGAAQIGDVAVLEALVEVVTTLEQRKPGAGAEQLRVYVTACLEDARDGKRPPSMFERLMKRDQRPG